MAEFACEDCGRLYESPFHWKLGGTKRWPKETKCPACLSGEPSPCCVGHTLTYADEHTRWCSWCEADYKPGLAPQRPATLLRDDPGSPSKPSPEPPPGALVGDVLTRVRRMSLGRFGSVPSEPLVSMATQRCLALLALYGRSQPTNLVLDPELGLTANDLARIAYCMKAETHVPAPTLQEKP